MQAKSMLIYEHIKDKLDRGAKEIEIHTVSNDLPSDSEIRRIVDLLDSQNARIVAVHLPIAIGKATTLLDVLKSPEDFIRWAVCIPLLTKHTCSIVVHNSTTLDGLKKHNITRGINHLKFILKSNPLLSLEIENSMKAIHKVELKDTLEVVKWARQVVSPHVNFLLDTAHMYADMFSSNQFNYPAELRDLIPLAKRVHLADCQDDGLNPKTHGVCFDSMDKLHHIIQHLHSLNQRLCYCFEVQEDNYLSSNNYSRMRLMFNTQSKVG